MIVLGVETFATHLFCTATHSYSRGVMAYTCSSWTFSVCLSEHSDILNMIIRDLLNETSATNKEMVIISRNIKVYVQ